MKAKKAADLCIGSFQGVDVYVDRCGQTYMDLKNCEGKFYLGVERDALDELKVLKANLPKKRTIAAIDADILRVSTAKDLDLDELDILRAERGR